MAEDLSEYYQKMELKVEYLHSDIDTIERVDLPSGPESAGTLDNLLDAPTLSDFQRSSEIAYLQHQLARSGWNIAATARAIGTPRSNLYKKMQAYGIKREES